MEEIANEMFKDYGIEIKYYPIRMIIPKKYMDKMVLIMEEQHQKMGVVFVQEIPKQEGVKHPVTINYGGLTLIESEDDALTIKFNKVII